MRKRPYTSLIDPPLPFKPSDDVVSTTTLRGRTTEERSFMNYTGSSEVVIDTLLEMDLIKEDDLTDVDGKKTLLTPHASFGETSPRTLVPVASLRHLALQRQLSPRHLPVHIVARVNERQVSSVYCVDFDSECTTATCVPSEPQTGAMLCTIHIPV